jgi:formylglycine-generating enzyme required for sulfatase activity
MGNVWEWTYSTDRYNYGHGGNWSRYGAVATLGIRQHAYPEARNPNYGFRLVREVKKP